MSGRTIGTLVGVAVGFFFPALAAIAPVVGGILGGALKPDKIQGVQLDDIPLQSSTSGNPRAIVLGTSVVKGTRVICQSEVRIVKETTQEGKGGGTEVENDVAYQDFTIEVCESSELRGTKVEAILAVWQDGVLVYDVRPTPLISAADSAKWIEGVTFYYGEETQLPDPTEESIYGVGQVPAYRGTCRMVFANRKISPRNSISSFEVLVSKCGVESSPTITPQILITGIGVGGTPTPFITGAAVEVPTLVGIPTATGASVDLTACAVNSAGIWIAVGENETLYSTDITTAWTNVPTAFPTLAGRFAVFGNSGWLIQYRGASHAGTIASASSIPSDIAPVTVDLSGLSWSSFSWINYTGGKYYGCIGFGGADLLWECATIGGTWTLVTTETSSLTSAPTEALRFFYDIVSFDGALYAACYNSSASGGLGGGDVVRKSTDGGATWDELVVDGRTDASIDPFQLSVGNGILIAVNRDVSKVWTSADGFTTAHATGVSRSVASLPRNEVEGKFVAYASGRFFIMGDAGLVSTTDGITFSAVASYPSGFSQPNSIAALGYDGVELPDAPGHYIDEDGNFSGPTTVGEVCGTTLDEVVSLVTRLCKIPDAEVDVSELEDIDVRGVTIQTHDNGRAILQPVAQTWFFDLPEFDSKLRAHRRGQAAVDVAINVADLLDTGEKDEDWRRGQQVTYPRKHHLGFMSFDLDYISTSAMAERTSPDVRVVGESRIGSVGVHTTQEATEIADIQLKVLWTEREGQRKFGLPLEYLRIVGGSIVTLENRRWRIDGYRIDNGAIYIEAAVYDRASAYTSTAVGATPQAPTAPGTGIRGPTDIVVMNMPVYRDNDDKPGLNWAARGYPNTAWIGTRLQIQRGATWFDLGDITTACGIGTLLSALPAHAGDVDEINTLHLSMSEDMDSTTFLGMLSERNPLAIAYPDGTVEVIQFQTATEISDGVYECTTLLRGRLDTVRGPHEAGARVVVLDNRLGFAQLRADDIGKTLTLRAVSLGTNPSAAPPFTITLTTMESQREWQPYNIEIESDGSGGYCISWIGRARLGSDAFPQHSQYFDGYSVRLTDGVVIHDIDTNEQSVCVDSTEMTAIFGGGYGAPIVSVVAKSTSSQGAFNPAAPTGWVAESGTWTEDPAGQYNLLPTGASHGRMYREALYPFTTGTIDVSVDKVIVGGFAFVSVDFLNADGQAFLSENGSSDGPTSTLSITAASLAPFGTVANVRVYLRTAVGAPLTSPVTFSSLSVVVTP